MQRVDIALTPGQIQITFVSEDKQKPALKTNVEVPHHFRTHLVVLNARIVKNPPQPLPKTPEEPKFLETLSDSDTSYETDTEDHIAALENDQPENNQRKI